MARKNSKTKKPPKVIRYDPREWPSPDRGSNQRIALTIDPGSVNSGIAITRLDKETGYVRPVCSTVLNFPIKGLTTNLMEIQEQYTEELCSWFTYWKPNIFLCERFQPRGLMGTLVEEVGISIGVALTLARTYKVPRKIVTAGVWKNEFHRRHNNRQLKGDVDLKELYAELHREWKVPAHQLDATLMGFYAFEQAAPDLEIKYSLDKLLYRVASTSMTRHKHD